MITQAYVWMLAELYLKAPNNPNPDCNGSQDSGCDVATSSEVVNHETDENADKLECKHEDNRACNKDENCSH
ncbi:MAG: hypothetical protein ABJ236_13390 [Lentilitoribacter sp.]